MIRTNAHMRALMQDPAFTADRPGVSEIDRYVMEDGWTVGPHGALLLAALWEPKGYRISVAGLGRDEYEINDLDLSLTDLGRDTPTFLPRAASRCLHVAKRLLTEACGLPGADLLVAAVTVHVDVEDEDFALQGGNVRFFTRRGDYPRWFDDLESFHLEAAAVLDCSEVDDELG